MIWGGWQIILYKFIMFPTLGLQRLFSVHFNGKNLFSCFKKFVDDLDLCCHLYLHWPFCKFNTAFILLKIGLRKWNFFGIKEFFSWILISKMDVEINLRIITRNHTGDPEIGFLAKSISKPNGCAPAMPTAWELKN